MDITNKWIIFNFAILALLIFDLTVLHKKAHVISTKESLLWTAFWVSLALGFNVFLYFTEGSETALNFLACYLVEESLSIDNLFVFLVIFKHFHVPQKLRYNVLFWGIIAAIVMRGIFIVAGIALISYFDVMFILFGLFLLYTSYKLIIHEDQAADIKNNAIVKGFQRFIPVHATYDDESFFTKQNGKWMATPLFLILMLINVTDLVFALDSIPAALGITQDPFIVYSSNLFAILGLRSIFFALNNLMELFHLLHYGLAIILGFIGLKMIFHNFIDIPIIYTLMFIVLSLGVTAVASIYIKKKDSL